MAGSSLWSAFEKIISLPGLAPGLMILVFGFVDWLLIASLPRLSISYGPLAVTLFLVLFVRLAVFACLGLVWAVGRHFSTGFLRPRGIKTGLLLLGFLNLLILGGELDALIIEPFQLQVTHIALPDLPSPSSKILRILHISDMHVERTTRRELQMLELVHELKPDLILLTGDYVNLDFRGDLRTWQDTRSILEQLDAHFGVYAIPGTAAVDTPENLQFIFSGLKIHLLQDDVQRLEINGQDLYLLGINNLEGSRDAQALRTAVRQVPENAFTVLLYHTPDLIEIAVQEGIDLYVAGHTHGGQVRLPFYGALITFSTHGKEFEGGLYQRGPTTLFVSRGVGMEGMGLPRMRFLCPPEIALIEVGRNER